MRVSISDNLIFASSCLSSLALTIRSYSYCATVWIDIYDRARSQHGTQRYHVSCCCPYAAIYIPDPDRYRPPRGFLQAAHGRLLPHLLRGFGGHSGAELFHGKRR